MLRCSAAYIRLVLSSLLDQTVPPDRILLGLQQSVDAGTLELWQGLHSKVQVRWAALWWLPAAHKSQCVVVARCT